MNAFSLNITEESKSVSVTRPDYNEIMLPQPCSTVINTFAFLALPYFETVVLLETFCCNSVIQNNKYLIRNAS